MPTALITGAKRGLGAELARQYAAEGWQVIATTRQDMDVTDRAAIARRAAALAGTPIDLLFCNAGIAGRRGMALGSFDYDSWAEVLRVNVLGVAAVVEAFAGHVAASERKLVALMSSRLGSIAESSGHTLPYSTSKAAVNMLAKGLAAQLAPRGVTVVALHPGWVRTDMGGAGAPLAPQDAVAGLRRVLAGVKRADSGRFFNYDGAPIPW